ncbi:MAG TPA: helix-turn-helix domain-containing protein [Acidimicrobiales bacterium]|nr:helix-turn-helix domain-containing protein [Acidimicrobiales bacterium]
MPTQPDEWLTVGEAAELIGIHPTTLRRYEREGLIKARRTPTNQRRFRRSDVEKLLPPPDQVVAQ